MAVQRNLPDPFNAINSQGNVGSTAPVGFAGVTVTSKQDIMKSRTNSGVTVTRAASYHMFQVNVSYNPMTKANFDLIYAFILEKQASLRPFFVQLPQHYSSAASGTSIPLVESATIGTRQVLVNTTATINVGDMFNIVDANGVAVNNHTKAYQIVRVETSSTLHSDATLNTATNPTATNHKRLTFTPNLFKAATYNATSSSNQFLEVGRPKIQVLQSGNTQQYQLNADNL